MFKKVLIPNRGEIALRIMRACIELDIIPVIAYSLADKDSLPVLLAKEKFCIGPAAAEDSYLNISNIITAALATGCDAIHPGYGFLAEKPRFAEICEAHGIVFIGPSADNIEVMGDKIAARNKIKDFVPVIPGSLTTEESIDSAIEVAKSVGYPVILKAVGGGGGKGMRVCANEKELRDNFNNAGREAGKAFGDSRLYIEKLFNNVRHIEIQIAADHYGRAVSFPERDCSAQRKNQKLTEESPSTAVNEKLREQMGRAALEIVKAVGYTSVGTIEFLLAPYRIYHFLEVNPRIQVEHPVTEMITGIDLVKEQIRIAAGEELSIQQQDIKINGHAIECRINAEDPDKNFFPCAGRIDEILYPGGPGVRFDTYIYPGCSIPVNYDSLIGKLIVWGRDREEAIVRMRRALSELTITPIKTTGPFLRKILGHPLFIKGDITTRFIENIS